MKFARGRRGGCGWHVVHAGRRGELGIVHIVGIGVAADLFGRRLGSLVGRHAGIVEILRAEGVGLLVAALGTLLDDLARQPGARVVLCLIGEGAPIARGRGHSVLCIVLGIIRRGVRAVPVAAAAEIGTDEVIPPARSALPGAKPVLRSGAAAPRLSAAELASARLGAAVGTGNIGIGRELGHLALAGAAERRAVGQALPAVIGMFVRRGDGIVRPARGRIVRLDAAAAHAGIEVGILVVDEVLGVVLRGRARKEDVPPRIGARRLGLGGTVGAVISDMTAPPVPLRLPILRGVISLHGTLRLRLPVVPVHPRLAVAVLRIGGIGGLCGTVVRRMIVRGLSVRPGLRAVVRRRCAIPAVVLRSITALLRGITALLQIGIGIGGILVAAVRLFIGGSGIAHHGLGIGHRSGLRRLLLRLPPLLFFDFGPSCGTGALLPLA